MRTVVRRMAIPGNGERGRITEEEVTENFQTAKVWMGAIEHLAKRFQKLGLTKQASIVHACEMVGHNIHPDDVANEQATTPPARLRAA